MTTRFKLTIEYDGTPYAGWQKQDHMPSVQQTIEQAIFELAQEETTVWCAGRTDSGVHARGQVAHVDIEKPRTILAIMKGLNFHLRNESISILAAEIVDDQFHARFSANLRAYEYHIINRLAPPKIEANRAWHVPWHLDAAAMHDAAQTLVGHHDFTSFRDAHCQSKSPLKTLDHLSVERDGERLIIRTQAQSFLHHMVRNMVGTLIRVGTGKWNASDMADALAAKDRSAAGQTAPAHGLYLMRVGY